MSTTAQNLTTDGKYPSNNTNAEPPGRQPVGAKVVASVWRTILETKRAAACVWAVATYSYSYRYRLLLLALLSPVVSIPPLLTPLVMQLLIDKAYPARDFHLFGWLIAALVVLGILPSALNSVSEYLMTYVESLVQCKLSFRAFNAIERLPQSYREGHSSGMFLERARNDVHSVAQVVARLVPQTVTMVFIFLAAIPLMLRLDVRISLFVLAIVPVNYLITARVTHKMVALSQSRRTIDERITTFISETIEGGMIARLFSLSRCRRKKLKQLLRDHLRITFATWQASTFWGQLASTVSMTWGLLLLCGGWYLVFTNRLQLGEAVALGMYVKLLNQPFQELASIYQTLMTNSVAARRVLDILNTHHVTAPGGPKRALTVPPRRFELRQVSFGYREGLLCLRDLDLYLCAGETVAVVGPSGAGKSTLIRILSGLDDRYQGQFLVDGHDFRTISRDSYLRHVSLVPQTTFFFSDSIRDNICPGNGSVSARSMHKYAKILGLDTVIDSTPDGYHTKLGSEGVRLSAGQYQKLATLRALLKDASVLLLDEVTSSMDIESERKLLQGIVALRPQGCATLLVTHHIAMTTEPWIDEIIVMVDGRIAESGSCAELREKGGFYHHWLNLNKDIPLDRAMLVGELSGQEC